MTLGWRTVIPLANGGQSFGRRLARGSTGGREDSRVGTGCWPDAAAPDSNTKWWRLACERGSVYRRRAGVNSAAQGAAADKDGPAAAQVAAGVVSIPQAAAQCSRHLSKSDQNDFLEIALLGATNDNDVVIRP